MILTSFPYTMRTTIQSGSGVRVKLPSLVHGLGGRRAILLTDEGLNKAGVTSQVTQLFEGMSHPVELVGLFDTIEQDARVAKINHALQFARERRADTLIALGGGSVLDTAKSVRWALSKGYNDIQEGLTFTTREQWPEAESMSMPFIAIPTTAGTGSEVSNAALVYNEKKKVKCSLVSPYLSPDIALLDPDLTIGLPPSITAFTGMDALTHALEGYFSSKANPITDAYALQAATLIVENLPVAVKEGTNLEARANMLMASSMAILAFTQTSAAIPVHNMAHVFGARFGVPHGLANAVFLPEVMESLPSLYLPRIQSVARTIGLETSSESADTTLEKVITFIRNFRHGLGLPDTFSDYHIDHLDGIVEAVHNDPTARFKIPEEVINKVANKVSGFPVKVQG